MMKTGYWRHSVVGWGKAADGKEAVVVGEVGDKARDPGYWGTSRMVLEAALCLAMQQKQLDADPSVLKGGVLTSASVSGAGGYSSGHTFLCLPVCAAAALLSLQTAQPGSRVRWPWFSSLPHHRLLCCGAGHGTPAD
jgi:hypothetical protein